MVPFLSVNKEQLKISGFYIILFQINEENCNISTIVLKNTDFPRNAQQKKHAWQRKKSATQKKRLRECSNAMQRNVAGAQQKTQVVCSNAIV